MRFTPTSVEDAWLVEIDERGDDRGFFARVWCRDEFSSVGLEIEWVQANVGFSHVTGTLRGLHLQRSPHEEWKLVRCTHGSLFDVVVDLRPGSPTYLEWTGATLSAENHHSMLVPPGCAHGYQTLEGDTELFYLTSAPYSATAATGVGFDDPAFGIEWPLPVGSISEPDRSWERWQEDDMRSKGLES